MISQNETNKIPIWDEIFLIKVFSIGIWVLFESYGFEVIILLYSNYYKILTIERINSRSHLKIILVSSETQSVISKTMANLEYHNMS